MTVIRFLLVQCLPILVGLSRMSGQLVGRVEVIRHHLKMEAQMEIESLYLECSWL